MSLKSKFFILKTETVFKEENDALRLKYDKLKYTSHAPKKTIPYAELYLKGI
jgi:hypothetical protein